MLDLENGDAYEGDTRDGRLHGIGRYLYANGNTYVGEYVDGKKVA